MHKLKIKNDQFKKRVSQIWRNSFSHTDIWGNYMVMVGFIFMIDMTFIMKKNPVRRKEGYV